LETFIRVNCKLPCTKGWNRKTGRSAWLLRNPLLAR
jgi:hypothetical protein